MSAFGGDAVARVRTVPKPPPRPPGRGARLRFGPYDRIGIDGVDYRCIETNEDGHVFQAAHDAKVHKAVRHDDMPELQDDGG